MSETLSRTVLHDWHDGHGGKMVDFAGWRMPVQYKTGIIAEHLATRRGAGLFDVSHMGRYRVTGTGAESFLSRTLTNNATGLAPLEAQYTFIANEAGGAIDDAYLYKLADEDFLLVVNAANRTADWEWLSRYLPEGGVRLADESAALAMLSLQGPAAGDVLTRLVDARELPENKRNRISAVNLEGRDLIVARTGYTGESVCFELFPESGIATLLWERLVEAGATPVGLGVGTRFASRRGCRCTGTSSVRDPTAATFRCSRIRSRGSRSGRAWRATSSGARHCERSARSTS